MNKFQIIGLILAGIGVLMVGWEAITNLTIVVGMVAVCLGVASMVLGSKSPS